jgi:hypothetical protein
LDEKLVCSYVYGLRLPLSFEKIHINSDSHRIPRATCDRRRTGLRLPCARILALVEDRRPERESRTLESFELPISSPSIRLRQFPPLPWLSKPKHVGTHRLSEPRDIPASNSLSRTSGSTRPVAPDVPTRRSIT